MAVRRGAPAPGPMIVIHAGAGSLSDELREREND
jgi:hypothetical protein